MSLPETVSNIYIQIYPDKPQPHWQERKRKSEQSITKHAVYNWFFFSVK